MTKELPEKLPLKSMDVAAEKREELRRILAETFPEAVAEEKIDLDQLKRVLGEWVEPDRERFGLNWPGKAACMKVIQAPSIGTLMPSPEHSVDWDSTQNVFIEGDNLEVLKLLQKAYFGKVKMIYIDPPYNTGKEFIYPDRYSETLDTYLAYTGQKDSEGRKFSTNTDASGRFHSRWLSMMYPRLYLAKNLLQDDGAIFISIDDNEQPRLRMLCDDVFGEDNFYSQIIVRANSRGQTYKQIAKTHEYIIVYTKTPETELLELEKDGDSSDLDMLDDIGAYNLRELRNRNPKFGKHNRPNLFYPVYVDEHSVDQDGLCMVSLEASSAFATKVEPYNSTGGESCWRWGAPKAKDNIGKNTRLSNLVARKKQDGTYSIFEKYRKTTFKPKSIWEDNSFLTESGTVELGQMGLGGFFDFPKPVSLIKQCVKIGSGSEDIILDFFAGSATLADAVMTANREDGGRRKYIAVQLPEPIAEDHPAYLAGYRTITEVSRERIKRAAKKGGDLLSHSDQDIGFRSFSLERSSFSLWDGSGQDGDEDLIDRLERHSENVTASASQIDLLFELLLKDGFPPTTKVDRLHLAGKEVFSLADGALLICLEDQLTEAVLDAMADLEPSRVICLDVGFQGNDQLKANAVQTFQARARSRETAIEFRTV